ncbi:MAG: HD domain-containing protein [Chloroflexota bacterium]|jgi:guanosine-3',5'-bis(diphosphate) 3'-pyrophosphohydrolase|nr:HD domain-containing protein [Chloroflexota bacterium]
MTSKINLVKIFEAINYAARKHHGQVRKDHRGSPYVTHPIAVANAIWGVGNISDEFTLICAILHDTIEDTDTKESEIKECFGEDVLSVVLEVSDDKSQEKMERKRQQVIHAPHLSEAARLIKLSDKLVNCRDILQSPPKNWSLTRRQEYIQWAADVVAEIRGTNDALESAFDQMLRDAEEQLEFTIMPFKSVNQRPWAPNPHPSTKQQE